jgi:uncharacterized ion transporter superfamily protein YfcC
MKGQEKPETSSIKVGLKPFITSVAIILALMVVSGILTRVLPTGHYQYTEIEGRKAVVQGSYVETGKTTLPVWRWFTAPVEVLWGDNRQMVAVIILFMVFLGGALRILEEGKILETALAMTVSKFRHRKYLLMAVVMFVMMFLASVVGIYEAMVPLVIFMVPLALSFGWDSLTGLGMSLLALAFGFAAAVTNPFTVAVAQMLSDLPLYSGSWLRIIFFLVTFVVCYGFVALYARKIERNPLKSIVCKDDEAIRHHYAPEKLMENLKNLSLPGMRAAMVWFSVFLGIAILFILLTGIFFRNLSHLSFPLVSLMFFIGGIGSGLLLRYNPVRVLILFGKGVLALAPGILLVLMAMSVPHIMTRGGVMDTILYRAGEIIQGTGTYLSAFYVYLLTLFLNFFIGSASAKAFLVMPIIVPLGEVVGLTRQTMVLAFDFGDGFSNMLFPTNALLLIGLSFASVSYTKWIRWTWLLQVLIFAVSMAFLMFAVKIGFGPF